MDEGNKKNLKKLSAQLRTPRESRVFAIFDLAPYVYGKNWFIVNGTTYVVTGYSNTPLTSWYRRIECVAESKQKL